MRAHVICVHALLLFVVGAACQSRESRFTSEQERCSFSELSGWTMERAKGSLLLRDGSGATLIVRAAPANEWVEARTTRLVLPATEKWLASLPQAAVSAPAPVRGDLSGASFEVTFTPQGQRERYLRRHAVLFGDDRVYHVIMTAPLRSAESGSKAFETVVDSFEEEV